MLQAHTDNRNAGRGRRGADGLASRSPWRRGGRGASMEVSLACSQAAQGGVQVRTVKGFDSLERLRGGVTGSRSIENS
jgi:hypothetical protein